MSFLEARIKHDIDNLSIPVDYKLKDNHFNFTLKIETSIYNRILSFSLEFPDEYPFKSPKLMCLSKIYHPNIDLEGHVCLKVLKEGWMPTYDLNSIIVSLIGIFTDLSGEDALNVEAGVLLENNSSEFKKKVNEYL